MLQILIWLICFSLVLWATGLVIQLEARASDQDEKSKTAARGAHILAWVALLGAAFFGWLAYAQGEEVTSSLRAVPGF
jgi:hypothetical protein